MWIQIFTRAHPRPWISDQTDIFCRGLAAFSAGHPTTRTPRALLLSQIAHTPTYGHLTSYIPVRSLSSASTAHLRLGELLINQPPQPSPSGFRCRHLLHRQGNFTEYYGTRQHSLLYHRFSRHGSGGLIEDSAGVASRQRRHGKTCEDAACSDSGVFDELMVRSKLGACCHGSCDARHSSPLSRGTQHL